MALYHFHVDQVKRSAGHTAIAAATYRSGTKLHCNYYGEIHDYTKKGGVIFSEIILPDFAPREYADRETLWNAVEKVEKHPKAQLAYSFDITLQNELSMEALIYPSIRIVCDRLSKRILQRQKAFLQSWKFEELAYVNYEG